MKIYWSTPICALMFLYRWATGEVFPFEGSPHVVREHKITTKLEFTKELALVFGSESTLQGCMVFGQKDSVVDHNVYRWQRVKSCFQRGHSINGAVCDVGSGTITGVLWTLLVEADALNVDSLCREFTSDLGKDHYFQHCFWGFAADRLCTFRR